MTPMMIGDDNDRELNTGFVRASDCSPEGSSSIIVIANVVVVGVTLLPRRRQPVSGQRR
jgi:hypothetical protein